MALLAKPASPEQHGPPKPAARLYGLPRLRAAMKLSLDVPFDEVCEDAAAELDRLRDQVSRTAHRWPSDR